MSSEGLVNSWLQGIGLADAIPKFQAAGITSPSALAELDVAFFEGLGVEKASDRRKLFFLVQRIKMAVDQKDDSTATQVDAVLAETLGGPVAAVVEQQSRPMRNHTESEEIDQGFDDDDDDDTEDVSDTASVDTKTRTTKLPSPKRRTSRGRRDSGLIPTTKQRETTARRNPSMRTGKQLSTIPSNTQAPPSPLVSLDDLDKASAGKRQSRLPRKSKSPSRRRSSGIMDRSQSRERRRRSTSANKTRITTNTEVSFQSRIDSLRQENAAKYTSKEPSNALEEMKIRVVVRKRPATQTDVVHTMNHGSFGRLLVYNPVTKVDLTKTVESLPFCYDNVFDQRSTNVNIYEQVVRPLIPSVLDGEWASCFAYGQTGSGKTFTMMGNCDSDRSDEWGLYYLAMLDMFEGLSTEGFTDLALQVSFFEIYNGKLYDLLNGKSMVKCLEDAQGKVCFPGLTEHRVYAPSDVLSLVAEGNEQRATGSTSRNADSSRSHAVMQFHVYEEDGQEFSRLTFIDLAGSERGADTANADRATRLEGSEINTSLLALKEVIRSLATNSESHVPYRGCKLTQVLKESFVNEKGRSVMIACISPNIGNVETTVNTLRYANRVKERDSETGQLTGAALKASTESSTPTTQATDEEEELDNTAMLDQLLASPAGKRMSTPKAKTNRNQTELREAADALIVEHRDAMTALLDMVKDEMTLVNETDAGRQDFGSYVESLNAIHDSQLGMIEKLREHLLALKKRQLSQEHHDDDDSFEDLRH